MREIDAKQITETVAQMCKEAAYYLPDDVYNAMKKARETETSPVGQNVLDQIIRNAEIAKAEDRPYCQDTGMTIVFLEVGQDLHITGGLLEDAVNAGISKGYTEGYLRKSVVGEPLFNRVNTKDNTPGVIYTKIVAGDKLKITVAPKGFGSENKSGVKMLVPADGVEGVKKAVMDIILHASMNPCPPMVVGVGIGGTMDRAALLSKLALTRSVDERNPMPEYAKLEGELLELINQTGIGPQLGGNTSALAVNVEWGPTHIAGLPVAVTICCHAMRHKQRVL
ncbi:putative fumarate hydratase subunit alpha [Selenomonas ruminantium subsp. lactilytica TAM6421]|uniref:Fumarate hydratase n=2 Tax=Selenomonas ruminantium TaxID=971 RepID=A0A1K1P3J6_SELRU|nr:MULTISPECIES: fumarate hydratase [Selenomonas]MBQ1417514.1 fumarate hydratase [Selenomonas sp.]MBE6084365.1 fumarate hydratase [Selenomonas ruminantium]MBE6091872.1 fumarate hydratase [Selenomonas ruminantium]MBQ1461938.1 fumarate hydratase [Selenomonas sp.]MBQ1613075.1 fumarate hydratase [Selenomonas sp.]